MKKILNTITAIGCMALAITGCSTEDKSVKLPDKDEIQTIQYNSIKIPADRLDAENLAALIQQLESLQPYKGDYIDMNKTFDSISLIYENGNKDVFLFWEENNCWYAETLDGTIYENADFVQNYIDRKEIAFNREVIIPDIFWLIILSSNSGFDDYYNLLPELTNCLRQGYSLEQAAEFIETKVKRNEILYQYAVNQGFEPTDEELQNYISEITDELEAMPNYTDLTAIFTESGTNIEKEMNKRAQNIRKAISIQMLYKDRYDAFRCGEDKIEDTVYWDFETYWNAFLEKVVLTQNLSNENDIEIQIAQAMEYIKSNKELLENELDIIIDFSF